MCTSPALDYLHPRLILELETAAIRSMLFCHFQLRRNPEL